MFAWLGAQLWALVAWLAITLWMLARTGWRAFSRWYLSLTRKARIRFAIAAWVFVLTAPVWLINTAVAYYGHTVVFPLSPFFLREKLHALASYAAHRPFCAFMGHADIAPLIAEAEAEASAAPRPAGGHHPGRIRPASPTASRRPGRWAWAS